MEKKRKAKMTKNEIMKTYFISKTANNGRYNYKETKPYFAESELEAFAQALGKRLGENQKYVNSETRGKYVWNNFSNRVDATIERIDDEDGKVIYTAAYAHE